MLKFLLTLVMECTTPNGVFMLLFGIYTSFRYCLLAATEITWKTTHK